MGAAPVDPLAGAIPVVLPSEIPVQTSSVALADSADQREPEEAGVGRADLAEIEIAEIERLVVEIAVDQTVVAVVVAAGS